MIAAVALCYAPGAYLVGRPRGVPHIYTEGSLSPSGVVPRRRRTVCRAHTRMLRAISVERVELWTRVCVRCSRWLLRNVTVATRDEFLARFSQLSPEAIAAAIADAGTAVDLDHAAHLSLLVLGHPACTRTTVGGITIHDHVTRQRKRLASNPAADAEVARYREHGHTTALASKAERTEIYKQRQERIRQIGIRNATRRSPR